MTKAKTLKVLTLPDIHVPDNIDLRVVVNFTKDFKPDVIQFLGDATTAESCNPHKLMQGIQPDVDSIKEDYKLLEDRVLKPFKEAAPNAEMVFHLGNHEMWFYRAMQTDPKAKGMFGVEDNIDLKKYKMEIVPFNKVKKFGHLHYTHGHYTNQYHAAKMAINYRKCIIYGHVHDCQEFMLHSAVDEKEKIFAKSIGCLCTLNPDFLKGVPNKWTNAFHIAYIRPDKTFSDFTIIITNGQFTAPNGKVYK